MREIFFFTLFLETVCLMLDATCPKREHYNLEDAPKLFIQFIKDYSRYYLNSYDLLLHYDAFRSALIDINYWNQQTPPDSKEVYGINKYADFTMEEWQARKKFALYGYGYYEYYWLC